MFRFETEGLWPSDLPRRERGYRIMAKVKTKASVSPITAHLWILVVIGMIELNGFELIGMFNFNVLLGVQAGGLCDG